MLFRSDVSQEEDDDDATLMVDYTRVLSTERALSAAKASSSGREDLHSNVGSNGQVTTTRLGADSLERLLQKQKNRSGPLGHPTFHRGDVEYTTQAAFIVGIVGWISAKQKFDTSTFRSTIRKFIHGIDCDDIDLVRLGDDFSDVRSEAD